MREPVLKWLNLTVSKDLYMGTDVCNPKNLWHKRAIKKSYKKCRFATSTRCLRFASVLAHAHNYLSTTFLLLALQT